MQTATATSSAAAPAQATPEAGKGETSRAAPSIQAPAETQAKPEAQKAPDAAATPAQGADAKEPAKPEAKAEAPGEKKPDEAAKAEGDKAKGDKPAEEVQYDLGLPKDALLGERGAEEIKAFAKANGYSGDQAKAVAAFAEDYLAGMRDLVEVQWKAELTQKSKYKAELPQASERIKRHLERTAPGLLPVLDAARWGNKVELFDFLADVASQSADDKLVTGKVSVQEDRRSASDRIADRYNRELGIIK